MLRAWERENALIGIFAQIEKLKRVRVRLKLETTEPADSRQPLNSLKPEGREEKGCITGFAQYTVVP